MASQNQLQNLIYAFQQSAGRPSQQQAGPSSVAPSVGGQQQRGAPSLSQGSNQTTPTTAPPPPTNLSNLSNLMQLIGRAVPRQSQQPEQQQQQQPSSSTSVEHEGARDESASQQGVTASQQIPMGLVTLLRNMPQSDGARPLAGNASGWTGSSQYRQDTQQPSQLPQTPPQQPLLQQQHPPSMQQHPSHLLQQPTQNLHPSQMSSQSMQPPSHQQPSQGMQQPVMQPPLQVLQQSSMQQQSRQGLQQPSSSQGLQQTQPQGMQQQSLQGMQQQPQVMQQQQPQVMQQQQPQVMQQQQPQVMQQQQPQVMQQQQPQVMQQSIPTTQHQVTQQYHQPPPHLQQQIPQTMHHQYQTLNTLPSSQQVQQRPLPVQRRVPKVMILGLVDTPSRPWRLDGSDVQRLIDNFGASEGPIVLFPDDANPDSCVVPYSDPNIADSTAAQLNGVVLPGFGRIVAASLPASFMTGVEDQRELTMLVASHLNAASGGGAVDEGSSNATALRATGLIGGHAGPRSITTATTDGVATSVSVLDMLVEALTSAPGNPLATALTAALSGDDSLLQSSSDAVKSVVQAVRSDPALLPALQQRLAAVKAGKVPSGTSTLRNVASTNASSALPRRKVCRIELIDLFTFQPEFDVAALIVGPGNSNIKYVIEEAKNKVDIELDGVAVNEAPVAERLHLTVSAYDDEAYSIAVDALEDLLQSICSQFVNLWTERRGGQPVPWSVGFRRHEYKEDQDGQLVYMGQNDRPKHWLQRQRQPQVVPAQRYS